jgi:hypothetical protein
MMQYCINCQNYIEDGAFPRCRAFVANENEHRVDPTNEIEYFYCKVRRDEDTCEKYEEVENG